MSRWSDVTHPSQTPQPHRFRTRGTKEATVPLPIPAQSKLYFIDPLIAGFPPYTIARSRHPTSPACRSDSSVPRRQAHQRQLAKRVGVAEQQSSAGRPTTTAVSASIACRRSPTRSACRFTGRSRTAARHRDDTPITACRSESTTCVAERSSRSQGPQTTVIAGAGLIRKPATAFAYRIGELWRL